MSPLVVTCLSMLVLIGFLPIFQQLIHSNWLPSICASISKPDVNNSSRLALPQAPNWHIILCFSDAPSITHFLLKYASAQVDYGFVVYTVMEESLFCKVYDIVTYFIVECNEEAFIREDQRMAHQKGLNATVTLFLEIRGVNIVTST